MPLISQTGLGIWELCVALLQFFCAYYTYIISSRYVGSFNVLRLRWERGYDASLVGAKQLPTSRFLSMLISLISGIEHCIRTASYFDAAAGRELGIDVNKYFYWGYLLGCPLIVWDFAETLGMEGIHLLTAATFGALLLAFWSEQVYGSAHWVIFGFGCVLFLYIMYSFATRCWETLTVLRQHQFHKEANWLLASFALFMIGWNVFMPAWVIRDDIHNGYADTSVVGMLHGIGDIIAKPVFGIVLINYRQCTEDIHLKAILKALKWSYSEEQGLINGIRTQDMGSNMHRKVPEEVQIITVPALLDYAVSTKQPDEIKSAIDRIRSRHASLSAQQMQKHAQLAQGLHSDMYGSAAHPGNFPGSGQNIVAPMENGKGQMPMYPTDASFQMDQARPQMTRQESNVSDAQLAKLLMAVQNLSQKIDFMEAEDQV